MTTELDQPTPSPWRIVVPPASVTPQHWSIYGGSHRVLTIVEGTIPMNADARLLTAAPELLAALEECLPDLQHYVDTHGPGPDRRLTNAQAAIAKARQAP